MSNEIVVYQAHRRHTVYVSMDGGKSWVVIHPDGQTSRQWMAPVGATRYLAEVCCEHDCGLDHE